MLQMDKDSCKDTVIMFGGFHTQMYFSIVPGQYIDSWGLENMWIENRVLGEGACEPAMKVKGWNRVIRIHKLILEAFWSVLWACFKSWAEENVKLVRENLKVTAGSISDGFVNKDDRGISASIKSHLSETVEAKFFLINLKFLVQRMPHFASGEPT